MSDALKALDLARRHGVEITVDGDKLKMHAASAPPPDVVAAICAAKPDLIAILSRSAVHCIMCGKSKPEREEWTHAIRGRGDAREAGQICEAVDCWREYIREGKLQCTDAYGRIPRGRW